MPHRPATRILGALCALAAIAAPAAATAGVEPDAERPKLLTTGNNSELVKAVAIKKEAGLKEKTVMSLSPDELPRIKAGDTLRVNGEVQVSTTCVHDEPNCAGTNYKYSPKVYSRVVLSASPTPAAGDVALSDTESVKCTQRRPNRNHHCTLVFPTQATPVPDPGALPCPANACYVNVILGAHNRQAKRGNKVVLGGDRPDGSVVGDKGRLNVVHTRAGTPGPLEAQSDFLINPDLPLTEGNKVKRRVVFTVEIPPAQEGEVLVADASFVADIEHLPYNAYLSSRLIVAESPTAIDTTGVAKSVTSVGGTATESNGFNCTQGRSGYPTPCTIEKAGAVRFEEPAVDGSGNPVPLYLNLVAAAKPLLAEKVADSERVRLTGEGQLQVGRLVP
jgi:hypothetical protein